MSKLKVTDGKLDIKSVESLSREELRRWISARLHGEDMQVPDDVRQGALPHSRIVRLYPELNRPTREDIYQIVVDFVRDMARNPQSAWCGDAADELLLLAQSVCKSGILDYLLEMAADHRFFHPEETERAGDLHFRVLQTLVALGWRGTPEFWKEQAHLSPDRYAGVAFNGLALISLESAIALLTELPWTDEIEDQILTSLPSILEEYKVADVVPLLQCYLADMPERAQAEIRGLLEEEGISLSPQASGSRFIALFVSTGQEPIKSHLEIELPYPVSAIMQDELKRRHEELIRRLMRDLQELEREQGIPRAFALGAEAMATLGEKEGT